MANAADPFAPKGVPIEEIAAAQPHVKPDASVAQPGEYYYRRTGADDDKFNVEKKRWTWDDVAKFDKVELEPAQTMQITWQGLTLYVEAQRITRLPRPFYQVYRQRIDDLRAAEELKKTIIGQPAPSPLTPGFFGSYMPGAGGLPESLVRTGDE